MRHATLVGDREVDEYVESRREWNRTGYGPDASA